MSAEWRAIGLRGIISGYSSNQTITDLVAAGLVSEALVTEAARRLLEEQFRLGLFENPYVEEAAAPAVIGSGAHRAKGMLVQKQSVVLLQNQPLADLRG